MRLCLLELVTRGNLRPATPARQLGVHVSAQNPHYGTRPIGWLLTDDRNFHVIEQVELSC